MRVLGYPAEWQEAAIASESALYLTAQEAKDLSEAMHRLIEPYRTRWDDAVAAAARQPAPRGADLRLPAHRSAGPTGHRRSGPPPRGPPPPSPAPAPRKELTCAGSSHRDARDLHRRARACP